MYDKWSLFNVKFESCVPVTKRILEDLIKPANGLDLVLISENDCTTYIAGVRPQKKAYFETLAKAGLTAGPKYRAPLASSPDRLILPRALQKYFAETISILHCGNHIEVWDAGLYQKHLESFDWYALFDQPEDKSVLKLGSLL